MLLAKRGARNLRKRRTLGIYSAMMHGRYDGMGPATFWSGAPSLADLTCACYSPALTAAARKIGCCSLQCTSPSMSWSRSAALT